MERAIRDCSRVLNVSLAVSLCCLADIVGTNRIEEIQSILHDGEFNSKSFRDGISDMGACRAVSEDLGRK